MAAPCAESRPRGPRGRPGKDRDMRFDGDTAADIAGEVAAIVGHDGTGDIRVIVDCAMRDDPQVSAVAIVAIVREARAEAARLALAKAGKGEGK